MAFFHELGKKLSSKGQSMSRNMSGASDINRAIEQENKIIENNFYQIGRLYYTIHSSDCEADFSDMVCAIREAERKIADYQQQLRTLGGMVQCTNCGAVVQEAPFCTRCGSPLTRSDDADCANPFQCNFCGHTVLPGSKFCTRCGKPISSETKPEKQTVICEECSSPIAPGATFCSCCATPAPVQPNPCEEDDLIIKQTEENHQAPVSGKISDLEESPDEVQETQSGKESDEAYIIKCSNCGEDIKPGASFCTGCGIRIGDDGRVEESDFKVCVKCGALAEKPDVFCTECGARF
ncbi:MAG: zinc-ribbon domain-containing protein [Acutalibacteraceae bacterium]